MAASQLSPIIDSPPAPQPPPRESERESAQLPSVEARRRTSAAAGGSGAVTGVTVQVLEGGEDEEAPTQAKVEARLVERKPGNVRHLIAEQDDAIPQTNAS